MISRILTAAILLPIIVASTLYFSSAQFLLLIEVFLVVAVFELLRLVSQYGVSTYRITLPLTLLLPWIWIYFSDVLPAYLCFVVLLCMGWSVFHPCNLKVRFLSMSANLSIFVYLGIPFALAALLQRSAPWELLLILFIIWTSDIFAFFAGKKWGKHKITPTISPNKSLEGYAAGLLSSILTAFALGHFLLPEWSSGRLLLVGLLIGPLGMIGDLFESVLKRGVNLKDSSNLMPGHGGLLDRIDSLLFALPGYYVFSILIK